MLTAHEWLLPLLAERPEVPQLEGDDWFLFAHCTEKTKLPNAEKEQGTIFRHFGANLVPVSVAAGMYGISP